MKGDRLGPNPSPRGRSRSRGVRTHPLFDRTRGNLGAAHDEQPAGQPTEHHRSQSLETMGWKEAGRASDPLFLCPAKGEPERSAASGLAMPPTWPRAGIPTTTTGPSPAAFSRPSSARRPYPRSLPLPLPSLQPDRVPRSERRQAAATAAMPASGARYAFSAPEWRNWHTQRT